MSKKIILSGVIGFMIGIIAIGFVARYQFKMRMSNWYYFFSLKTAVEQSPECAQSLEIEKLKKEEDK